MKHLTEETHSYIKDEDLMQKQTQQFTKAIKWCCGRAALNFIKLKQKPSQKAKGERCNITQSKMEQKCLPLM